MASKRMDLNRMCLFVLSGVANPLGKELAVEMCSRFKAGSVAILVDKDEQDLQEVRKEIESLEHNIRIVCCKLSDEQQADINLFRNKLSTAVNQEQFELAFIVHNEGTTATHLLIEPENIDSWKMHVKQNVYTPIALNQEFLKSPKLYGLPKLIVNISSSLWIQPLVFKSQLCSAKKAREMYFRSLASEETDNCPAVINYGPGIFDTHKPAYDSNNNIITLEDLVGNRKLLELPRVDPLQSTLKLINILQEISFISGHDVDYYDTYNL